MSMMSETEKAYRNMLGESNELREPMSRKEKLLHKMLGEDIELEPAQSREEELLLQVIEQGGGGGGSSDFSIAHVALTNTAQNGRYYSVKCPHILGEYMEYTTEDITTIAPMMLDVVLYKGEQYILTFDWDTSTAPVISGDVTYDSEGEAFIITGDGSISLVGTAAFSLVNR